MKLPTITGLYPSSPYTADVKNRTEYYPYGWEIKLVGGVANTNRYGYNGTHLRDNDVKGEGNYLDFGGFGFDTRTARRGNIEPLIQKYPGHSSYMVFANNPIAVSDPDGREIKLIFESEAAKNAYVDLVNKSLGGITKISVITVEDVHGYTNKVVIESIGMNGPLTESQKAFYDEYSAAVKAEAVVRQEVVQSVRGTTVGGFYRATVI